jgi:hypothetical protein
MKNKRRASKFLAPFGAPMIDNGQYYRAIPGAPISTLMMGGTPTMYDLQRGIYSRKGIPDVNNGYPYPYMGPYPIMNPHGMVPYPNQWLYAQQMQIPIPHQPQQENGHIDVHDQVGEPINHHFQHVIH